MSVLVDTCVWSIALRRRPAPAEVPIAAELDKIIYHGEAVFPGIIRQEVLSGLSNPAQFRRVQDALRHFGDFPIETRDYESAAELFNLCRSKGVQGSHTDFLLCALSLRHNIPIFTTDKDFDLFSRHLKIRLHQHRF